MVVSCDLPARSALGAEAIARADFRDAYRVPLQRSELSVVDIFFAIFAHRPAWMNLALVVRNKAVALAGLEVPTTAEIMNLQRKDRYVVGEKIGAWPIFFLGPDELIAGRDNKHMDFRLSIMKLGDGTKPNAVVSTICMVRNRFGRYYLSAIVPFHKHGVRTLLSNAAAANRL
jgi:hypothetical protein